MILGANAADTSVHGLLLLLAGDALMAPFWPEGLGINRGFHSALDTAWSISRYTNIVLLGGEEEKVRHQQLTELLLARDGAYTLMRSVSGDTRCVVAAVLFRHSRDTRFRLQPCWSPL
jgi:hypothetical protein